jgi:cold shock protein
MTTGTVKYFNEVKGFGFIAADDGRGADLFVHIRSCLGGVESLSEGQRVRFEERASARHSGKYEAVGVELL